MAYAHTEESKIENEFIAHYREKDGESQSVSKHLLGVSKKTGEFASKIGLKEAGDIIGLLHDLGKNSREFQNYIGSATGLIDPDEDDYVDASGKKGKIDHSSAGAQILYDSFIKKGQEGLFIAQILALSVASHHSGLIDCISPDGKNVFSCRMNKSEEKTHKQEVSAIIDSEIRKKFEGLINEESIIQLKNKLISLREKNLDDQISQNFKIGLLVRYLFSCLIDADRLNTADFASPMGALLRNNGRYIDWQILIERLNKKLYQFDQKSDKNRIDYIRKDISNGCFKFSSESKGLYKLTVPTGGGKTLASLRFALQHAKEHSMDRIIYVIPFTSIIDQNAEEARKILEDKDSEGNYLSRVILEHHSNLTPEEETWKQKLLAEDWDAPVVFTTNVQFLEALFGYGTRSARRMHQLANSVIIFDEVQTLPVRCVYLFNLALRFLVQNCGSTVVLCTATQPLLDRIEPKQYALPILPEHHMMNNVNQLFKDLKRIEVFDNRKTGGWTETEIKNLAISELQETGGVLIVVNTKASAEKVYGTIAAKKFCKTLHLSTNMCPRHRMIILKYLKRCLRKKEPVICVSTQLIEAGVDIDFGSVIRYLAGLDSIAQAAGRCNREGILKDSSGNLRYGRVFIINPAEENLDKLTDLKTGKAIAERILNEYKNNPEIFDDNLIGTKAMELYYQYYFYERRDEMNYQIKLESGSKDNIFNLLSNNNQAVEEYKRVNGKAPDIPLRQAFMTAAKEFRAIDSPARGVIVPFGTRGKKIINLLSGSIEIEKEFKLLKESQRYSINVFPHDFDELIKQKAINETQIGSGIYHLDDQFYSNEFGLSKTSVKDMKLLNA